MGQVLATTQEAVQLRLDWTRFLMALNQGQYEEAGRLCELRPDFLLRVPAEAAGSAAQPLYTLSVYNEDGHEQAFAWLWERSRQHWPTCTDGPVEQLLVQSLACSRTDNLRLLVEHYEGLGQPPLETRFLEAAAGNGLLLHEALARGALTHALWMLERQPALAARTNVARQDCHSFVADGLRSSDPDERAHFESAAEFLRVWKARQLAAGAMAQLSVADDDDSTIHNAVGVLMVDDRLVVIERKNQPGLFGLPGGKIEPGETAEEAVVRELLEELGLRVEIVGRMLYKGEDTPGKPSVTAAFRVRCLDPEPQGDYIGPEGQLVRLVAPAFVQEPANSPYWEYNQQVHARLQCARRHALRAA